MKDEIIAYKTAKLASEKGFKLAITTDKRYTKKGVLRNWGYNNNPYLAPTQSLLQKWLREKFGIHVEVFWVDTLSFLYVFKIITTGNPPRKQSKLYQGYENTLENGLQEALTLIKL